MLEFNARLGDPETQAILHRMDSDFAPVLQAAANGDLAGASIEWKQAPSVCVVLAAHGYPGEVRTGDLITGIDRGGTRGRNRVSGGNQADTGRSGYIRADECLVSPASGPDLQTAIANTYRAAQHIHFKGMHFRKDIGAKGLKRY